MPDQKGPSSGFILSRVLPGLLLVVLCLLTVVWLAPDVPYFGQDSGWPLALDQAVGDRLIFGRDILFNLGPWSAVYSGQYHPATDGLMLVGGTLVALALSSGLIALARGGRLWAMLLVPLLVATVGQRDPVFMALPLLLLAVAVSLTQPAALASAIPRTRWNVGALLLLTVACALLSFVKSTFGTQTLPLIMLALIALAVDRQLWLAALMVACYAVSLAGFWLAGGQHMADLPGFFAGIPMLINGYTEGLAKSGPWTDIAAYLAGTALLLALFWLDRTRRRPFGNALLLLGFLFTLFVAFKAGFVRHDEHALIAAGSIAMLPLVLANMWRARSFAVAMAATLSILAFISHHYSGFEWPSAARGETRLASAVAGSWARVVNPGRLESQFNASMARIRAGLPLPRVTGPSDIYSSGQATLLANGLDWSPRPALQSMTVASRDISQADLDHLEGAGGQPPVQNVFYSVENEDNRLPSTQDGLSWPALLSQFRVASYDRGQDMALLQRQPGVRAAEPSGPALLKGQYQLGETVPVPVLPGGLGWATLDLQPTLLGRLAAFLFRPPALFITIRYANGPLERYRLLSGLAQPGFLLTPQIRNTADMLWLLLPERREPKYRPVSINVSGESGTRWLWKPQFAMQLQTIAIPIQPQVREALLSAPHLQAGGPAQDQPVAAADVCALDTIGDASVSAKPVDVQGDTRVTGWFVASITGQDAPDHFFVRLTNAAGQTWQAPAAAKYRPDVAGYFVNQALVRSGFDVELDLSGFAGAYTLSLEAERGKRRWQCKLRQDLVVGPPTSG